MKLISINELTAEEHSIIYDAIEEELTDKWQDFEVQYINKNKEKVVVHLTARIDRSEVIPHFQTKNMRRS